MNVRNLAILFFTCFPLVVVSQSWEEYLVAAGLKIKFQYNDSVPGVPDGAYQMFLESKLIVEGTFKSGKRHGKWITYYSSGDKQVEGYYVNNKKHHKWQYFREDNSLLSEVYFFKGVRYGTWKSFHKNGEPWSTIIHESGGKPQEVAVYDEQNTLLYHRYWSYTDSLPYSKEEKYYTNGDPHIIAEYTNGLLDGEYISYHPKKIVSERKEYQMGQLIVVRESRSWNGQPLNSGSFFEGEGDYKGFYTNGIKQMVVTTGNTSKADTVKTFYRNGVTQDLTVFQEINGKTIDVHKTFFNEQGKPYYYSNYIAEKDLFEDIYGKNPNYGERLEVTYYNRGPCESSSLKEYDATNNLIKSQEIRNGLLHGKQLLYHPSGGVKREAYYEYGDLIGEEKFFNSGGKVVERIVYPSLSGEVEIDTSWCEFEEKGPSIRLPIDRNFFVINTTSVNLFRAELEELPGLENQQITQLSHLIEFEKQIGIYEAKRQLGSLQYPDGIELYVEANLRGLDIAKMENVGVVNMFGLTVNEMGLIEQYKVFKKDALGVSQGLDNLLLASPLFHPTMVNGFPVGIYSVYLVQLL